MTDGRPLAVPGTSGTATFQSRSIEEGRVALALAVDILLGAGSTDLQRDRAGVLRTCDIAQAVGVDEADKLCYVF